MKKILLVMLLTFTTMANADEGRYTMIAEPVNDKGGIWIIDNETNETKYCWEYEFQINCTYWYTLDKHNRNDKR